MNQRFADRAHRQHSMKLLLKLSRNGGQIGQLKHTVPGIANHLIRQKVLRSFALQLFLRDRHLPQFTQELGAILRQLKHVLPAFELILKRSEFTARQNPRIEQVLAFRNDLLLPPYASLRRPDHRFGILIRQVLHPGFAVKRPPQNCLVPGILEPRFRFQKAGFRQGSRVDQNLNPVQFVLCPGE